MRLPILFLLFSIICSCKNSFDEVLISLDKYKIEEGFDLQIIASEPLLTAPVAIDFDAKGRIWVTGMTGYMADLKGTGESAPTGSIQILEDRDKDGVMDHAKIFLDSLVLPRALAHVYGGLLYAEPPNLWFVEIENDKPSHPVLVDSIYAPSGNPEHQPNGLLLNIDNWIYSAKSQYRYRRKNGEWLKEPTSFRGQWGISHDNFGRLYYNDNSRQILGDYVLPNRLIRNRFFEPKEGINQLLTEDQRVYPSHPSLVNRGYDAGVLDKDSLLINVTAACGPLVYRGGTFDSEYDQNVFVCVPEANLIKRNILTFKGDRIEAQQAWQGKEFLSATDDGFRPVNLNNGPDGAMYVVDMHRGLISHHAYLSPYLKKKYEENKFDSILNFGRILKVTKTNVKTAILPDLDKVSGEQLVNLLKDTNGWVRNRAQHHIIFKNIRETIPKLLNMASDPNDALAQLHALYALEGLDALSFELLLKVAKNSDPDVTSHAIVMMENFVSKENAEKVFPLFQFLKDKRILAVDLYLSSSIGIWASVSKRDFLPLIFELYNRHLNNPIFQEAILSGISGVTQDVLSQIRNHSDTVDMAFQKKIAAIIENQKSSSLNPIFSKKILGEDDRTRGAKLFRQICASCHGLEGEGIDGLAPPLMKSEYISNFRERLVLIILHGLKGPIHVRGQRYELNQVMPGLLHNNSLSDDDISDIVSYITNAFSDVPKQIKPDKIRELRNLKPQSGMEYTEDELNKVVFYED